MTDSQTSVSGTSSPGDLFAHSARPGLCGRQLLAGHLRGVGRLAFGFAEPFGAGSLAQAVGLRHDVGKAKVVWQQALIGAEDHERRTGERRRVGVGHKEEAAWLLSQLWDALGQLAFGHHGCIPSRGRLKIALGTVDATQVQRAIDLAARTVPELEEPVSVAMPDWLVAIEPLEERQLALDLLLRMIASAVYDADVLDTIQHEQGLSSPPVYDGPDLGELAQRFEGNRATYLAHRAASPFSALREELGECALQAAQQQPGVFRMPFPTGAGKTLSGARFAVHHAQRWGHRRLIYAAPFLTVTEQNADVLRRMFAGQDGVSCVVEHHSAAELDRLAPANSPSLSGPANAALRRAAENWDAPVMVTTVVQLFESLFSNRPGALRKVHRLAGAVIVLDEVQSLPDRLLVPILSALRMLAEHFGTTVVLCTATQPAFEYLPVFRTAKESGLLRDVVCDPQSYVERFRRVRYEWRLDPKPSLEQIADEVAGEQRAMVIVNTTKDSARLHRMLTAAHPGESVFHLSTRMQARHRWWVLGRVRQRLADGLPVLLVATQLVEAGVELDFPVVFRALAPAESLCQAAGRANRDGLMDHPARVVVFAPSDGASPPGYRSMLAPTLRYFGAERADPDDLGALRLYYKERYQNLGIGRGRDLGCQIERARRDRDFDKVAELFHMIDDFAVPVLVEWSQLGGVDNGQELTTFRSLVAQARSLARVSRNDMRRLQQWTANVPRPVAQAALRDGTAEPVLGDLLLWRPGRYHPHRGIEPEGAESAFVF